MAYQVWIKTPSGAVEHTTLREDEWLTVDVREDAVEYAIEEHGWCGTYGTLSGNRVVFQDGTDDTICPDALEYLNGEDKEPWRRSFR